MISYKPFWDTLEKRNLSTYELITFYRISGNTMQKIRDNENMTIRTIERLCKILQCNIQDIVEVNV